MITYRPPRRLQPGDTVGIISPSSPVTAEALANMTTCFEERGYSVQAAPNALARFGFMAGTPEQRAADLNLMLRDPRVRMVMTSMGGAGPFTCCLWPTVRRWRGTPRSLWA